MSEQNEVFQQFLPSFSFIKLQTSRGVTVKMLSRDRLITSIIGRKLDKN